MKNLELIQKLSILHCVYQMIASADGSVIEERDEAAIEYALSTLDLSSDHSWQSALKLNPYDCFTHVSGITDDEKKHFETLLLNIADMGGNKVFRMTCAKHIFQLCRV